MTAQAPRRDRTHWLYIAVLVAVVRAVAAIAVAPPTVVARPREAKTESAVIVNASAAPTAVSEPTAKAAPEGWPMSKAWGRLSTREPRAAPTSPARPVHNTQASATPAAGKTGLAKPGAIASSMLNAPSSA